MANKTLIAILIILNIAFSSAATTQQNVQQGKELFQKLRNSSDIGRNLVDTIQLELSTAQEGEDQTIVSKVIEMLKEVQQSLLDQQGEFKEEVESKNAQCYEQVTDLKEEIKNLDERIDGYDDVLPLRQDEFQLKQQQLDAVQEEVAFYLQEIVRIDAKAQERKQAFEDSKEEHDNMTAALVQAKRLIKQLVNSSFLQKDGNKFAQLSSHFEQSVKNVESGHNKGFLGFLLQMSQVSDQDQVSSLIDIIDELIAQIAETARAEYNAEQGRINRYTTDRTRLQALQEQAEANVRELQADIRTAELRFKEAQSERDAAQQSRDSKQEQLDDHRRSCDDQTSSLSTRIVNFDEILDIIRQVILLLENSSIQGATDMVSDLDPSSAPQEESLLGDYNTDSGSLPSRSIGSAEQTSQFVQKQRSPLGYDPLDN